jgi:hypothetical protein
LQGLVVSVVSLLGLDGYEVVAVFEGPSVAVPVDPFGGGDLDSSKPRQGLRALISSILCSPTTDSASVVVGGAHRSGRGLDARGLEPFGGPW